MIFRTTISTAALAALFAFPVSVNAELIDDFEGDTIDYSRWRTYSTEHATELVRDIINEELVLHAASDGTSGSVIDYARSHLIVNDANPPEALQGTVTVDSVNPGPDGDGASIAVEGFYYNADRSGAAGSGDRTGDVYAAVEIGDWGSGLEAWYTILESTDAGFTNSNVVDQGQITDTLTTGMEYTVAVEYTGSNTFNFSVGPTNANGTGPTREGAAALDYQQIAAYVSDGAGPASVTGTVDDVYLNNATTVYDDFAGNRLDNSQWYESLSDGAYLEGQRNVENGQLRLDIGFDDLGDRRSPRQRLITTEPLNPDYFEAKVSIPSSTHLDNNINGVAGISGYLYNEQYDGSSGYNGAEGDVWGLVYLFERDGVLHAGAYLESEHADFSTRDAYIDDELFMKPVQHDEEYTLWMERDGDQIRLGIDDEVITHTVSTPMHDPSPAALGGYRAVRTNLSGIDAATNTAGGVARATFDDVRTDSTVGADTDDESGTDGDGSDGSGGGGGGGSGGGGGTTGLIGLLLASLTGVRRLLVGRS